MSARSGAAIGAHSGGLATTVLPAARAGTVRQVASMSGAHHGVMTAVTPAGSHEDVVAVAPGRDVVVVHGQEVVGDAAEVHRQARHHSTATATATASAST